MRVFLFLSKDGDSLPLAQRVMDEGHRVQFYINSPDRRRIGEGLIEKSTVRDSVVSKDGKIDKSIIKYILYPKPDCVVFDMAGEGFGKLADIIRGQGYPVVGLSQWGNQVELDRPYGHKIMKMQGINTPKTYQFTDYKTAIQFVEEKNKPYVYKPSGNQPTTTTYVAQKAGDLIGMLEYYSNIKEEFELQEKVNGIEVSSELWFNGTDVLSVNHTMEEKTLMEGGIGPRTGCMGDVVWIGTRDSKLYHEGIGKMVPVLKKLKYRGPLDLNTIVGKDKLWGLEFSARFGYNAIFSLLELYNGRVNDLLYGVASGVLKTLSFKEGWGVSVSVCVEPYPLSIEPKLPKDILVQGVSRQNSKHIWFYDVYKKGDRYLCAGNGGNIGTITGRSLKGQSNDEYTVREAKRRAYRTLSNLIIPDVMYRRDIGLRVEREYGQLREWGWL